MRPTSKAAAQAACVFLLWACAGGAPARPAPANKGPFLQPMIAAETPDEAAGLTSPVRGYLIAGLQAVGGSSLSSSKFTEYREVPSGLFVPAFLLTAETKDATRYVKFWGANFLQRDEFVGLRLGKYGGQQLLVTYDMIPHDFSNTGQLFFRQSGPGLYTLPVQVRADLKTIASTDTNPAVAGTQIDTAAFGSIVEGLARPVGLSLDRRRTTVAWIGDFSPDLDARVSYAHESYHGQRPFGTTFAFANSNQLPEPMDYNVDEVRAGVEYGASIGTVRLSATHSAFHNDVKAVVWDNPIQTADAVGSPAQGRISLPPDNTADNVMLAGVVRLARIATMNGAVSRGTMRQNEGFLPYTINSALVAPALPAASANAKIDTSLLSFNLNVTPHPIVSLRAFYRQYENDNETPILTFPGSVLTDTTVETGPFQNQPFGYKRRNAGVDVAVDPIPRLTLHVTGDQEIWSRQYRDVNKTRDNRLGFAADYRLGTWLTFRGSLREGIRRIEGAYVGAPAQLPELRKFDEADRNRNEATLILQAAPGDGRWDTTLTYTRLHDHFPRSSFGLTRADSDSFTVETAYMLSDRTSLFAGWVPERMVYDMNSRYRPVPAGQTQPVDNPLNNWSSAMSDHVQTYWVGANHTLIPNKLDVGVYVSSSVGKSRITSFGVPGGDPASEPPALPQRRYSLFEPTVEFQYRVAPSFTTALGYRFEQYRERYFEKDVMQVYMPQSDALTSTWLGARQPGYDAHIVTFEMRKSF